MNSVLVRFKGRVSLFFLTPLMWSAMLAPLLVLFPSSMEAAVGSPAATPRIFCEETNFGLGTVPLGSVKDHTFVLQNRGNAVLTIFQSTACCVTAVRLSTNILAPGESATLTASFGITGYAGDLDRWISLVSDDPAHTNYTLYASGI